MVRGCIIFSAKSNKSTVISDYSNVRFTTLIIKLWFYVGICNVICQSKITVRIELRKKAIIENIWRYRLFQRHYYIVVHFAHLLLARCYFWIKMKAKLHYLQFSLFILSLCMTYGIYLIYMACKNWVDWISVLLRADCVFLSSILKCAFRKISMKILQQCKYHCGQETKVFLLNSLYFSRQKLLHGFSNLLPRDVCFFRANIKICVHNANKTKLKKDTRCKLTHAFMQLFW